MLQRQRMILIGRVSISQRRMAGITGFGSQTEIGKLQVLQSGHLPLQFGVCSRPHRTGMQRKQCAECQTESGEEQKLKGAPHDYLN